MSALGVRFVRGGNSTLIRRREKDCGLWEELVLEVKWRTEIFFWQGRSRKLVPLVGYTQN